MPVSLKSVLEGETRNDLVFHFVGILVFKAASGHAKIRLFFCYNSKLRKQGLE